MDNDDGKWIHVGKVPKTKAQKEEAFKNMPKLKDLGHSAALLLDEFDAGDSEPLQDMSNIQNQPVSKSPGKQTSKKKTKKAVPESKYDYKTFESAINNNHALVDSILKLKEKFSDNPAVWPKEVAACLNSVLKCPEDSPVFAGKAFEYPMCKAKKNVQDALMKLFGEDLNEAMIPLMYQHCLNAMLENITRDTPTWGYRLCLQALAHTHPKLCCEELDKYSDKITTMLNVPKKSMSLLWALGQIGVKSSKCGMKVWLEVMLPHLHIKTVSQYAMLYIETIMSRCKTPAIDLKGSVSAKQYMKVARWAHDNSGTVKHASAVQYKMLHIYPTFRALATDAKARKRQVFSSLLMAAEEESPELTKELTSVAMDCLKTEPTCFKLWGDAYTTSFYRTRHLLTDISERWEIVVKEMPEKQFKETMRAFHSTNADAAAQSDFLTGKPEFPVIRQLCEGINEQLSDPLVKTSPCLSVFVTAIFVCLLALGIAFVYTDIETNGGVWEQSNTYIFLKSKGIISVTDNIWSRLRYFTEVTSSWLRTNVPFYWSTARDILGPYMSELAGAASGLWQWLVEATLPAKTWLFAQTSQLSTQVVAFLKVVALRCLELLDVCADVAYEAAVWTHHALGIVYQLLHQIASGEFSLVDLQSASRRYAMMSYDCFNGLVQHVGNYIAPDNP